MWSSGGELTNLFQNHEIVLAMGWPLNTNDLRKLNFPIGETIPRENTTGWIDHLMITSASSNKELAHAFLEYMIQAKTQKLVTDRTHYTPANPGASQFLTPDEMKASSGQSGRVHAAHLFLAGRFSPREVQRNLERSQSGAVSSAAANSRRPDRDQAARFSRFAESPNASARAKS